MHTQVRRAMPGLKNRPLAKGPSPLPIEAWRARWLPAADAETWRRLYAARHVTSPNPARTTACFSPDRLLHDFALARSWRVAPV